MKNFFKTVSLSTSKEAVIYNEEAIKEALKVNLRQILDSNPDDLKIELSTGGGMGATLHISTNNFHCILKMKGNPKDSEKLADTLRAQGVSVPLHTSVTLNNKDLNIIASKVAIEKNKGTIAQNSVLKNYNYIKSLTSLTEKDVLLMEYVKGVTLDALIHNGKKFLDYKDKLDLIINNFLDSLVKSLIICTHYGMLDSVVGLGWDGPSEPIEDAISINIGGFILNADTYNWDILDITKHYVDENNIQIPQRKDIFDSIAKKLLEEIRLIFEDAPYKKIINNYIDQKEADLLAKISKFLVDCNQKVPLII